MILEIIFSVFVIGTFVLVRFLYKSWLYPICVQYMMSSQGIKGPSYKFLDGNNTEIGEMLMKYNSAPMDVSSHDIFPRLQPHYHSWIKLYGNTSLHWVNTKPHLLVDDVELIKEVLTNKEGTYGKPKYDGILKKLLGDGSVFQEGKKWMKLRKVSDHVFHAQSLKAMFPGMVESVEAILKTWKPYEGKEIEMCEEFKRLSLEIISNSVFGGDHTIGKHIFDMLDQIAYLSSMNYGKIRNPIMDKFFKSSEERQADKILEELFDSFIGIIKQREEKVLAGQFNNFGCDFLGSLLQSHHNADKNARISVHEVIEECKSFYFAGHKTVTSLLSWCILQLSIHTEWQEKVREEVLEVLGQENPTTESISRLKIMGMIMNETLRLYPPFILLHRETTRKTNLGKLKVPTGTGIIISTLSIHHNSEIWGKDAHLYKPERFAEGVFKAARDSMMAFLAFGFGPRKCVGFNFASTEVKIALCMILQRYRFKVSPNYSHFPCTMFSLRPKDGLPIMLYPL